MDDTYLLWFPMLGAAVGWLLGAAVCLAADRAPRLTPADRELLVVAAAVGVCRR